MRDWPRTCGNQMAVRLARSGKAPPPIWVDRTPAFVSRRPIATVPPIPPPRPPSVSSHVTSTKLLRCYFQHGLVDHAQRLFEEIPDRDVVVWTSMISGYTSNERPRDAWKVFRAMLEDSVEPNAYTISSALMACRALGWLLGGKLVHGLAVKCGLVAQLYVDNMLLDVYATSDDGGRMDDALAVFEWMTVKTEVSWTMLISGYKRSGDYHAAIGVFQRMLMEDVKLGPFSCSIAIRACASIGSISFGRQLHATAVKSTLETSLPVSNSLLDMYCRCMNILEAKKYFDEMLQKDLITWNTMITGFVRCSPREALQSLLDMELQGLRANCITLCSVIAACVELAVLNCGQQVHATVLRRGFARNVQVANALIDMYAKCGTVLDAQRIFDEMVSKDIISWTTMLNGYGVHGHAKEAIELFDKMVDFRIPLDDVVFVGVLSACSHAGLVDEGLKYFNQMVENYGVHPSLQIYGCVIDLFGRAGRIDEAYTLLKTMSLEPDETIWGALLAACRMHKNASLGKLVAEEILRLKPDEATPYVVLSNIYAADGEWNEFARTRKMVKSARNQKEAGRSWIEIKDSVCSFAVEDRCEPQAQHVYDVLETLLQNMSNGGYVSDWPVINSPEGVT